MIETENIPVGTKIVDQLLLITEYLRSLCRTEQLDDVAVLRTTFGMLIEERINQTRGIIEIRSGADVRVRNERCVEHQVRHCSRMNLHIRRANGAHDRADHIRHPSLIRNLVS